MELAKGWTSAYWPTGLMIDPEIKLVTGEYYFETKRRAAAYIRSFSPECLTLDEMTTMKKTPPINFFSPSVTQTSAGLISQSNMFRDIGLTYCVCV